MYLFKSQFSKLDCYSALESRRLWYKRATAGIFIFNIFFSRFAFFPVRFYYSASRGRKTTRFAWWFWKRFTNILFLGLLKRDDIIWNSATLPFFNASGPRCDFKSSNHGAPELCRYLVINAKRMGGKTADQFFGCWSECLVLMYFFLPIVKWLLDFISH